MQTLPLKTQNKTQNKAQRPRRKPQWGTLLPALAAGLAAAILAFLLVRGHLPAAAATVRVVSVVVAAHAIPARTRLTASLLHLRSIPAGDAPAGAVQIPAQLLGKVSMQPIPAGAAVTQDAVAGPNAGLGLAFALPPTQRAVTVATDPADGVDLFVRPEDHVDILVTDEPGTGPAEARTVLQNVLLLAVGTQTTPDPPPASSAAPPGGAAHVTVAVTPSQAQALVLASARGHLHLALRAIGDSAEAELPAPLRAAPLTSPIRRPASQEDHVPPALGPLPPLSVSALPALKASPPGHVTVTIIKGTVSQTVTVAP